MDENDLYFTKQVLQKVTDELDVCLVLLENDGSDASVAEVRRRVAASLGMVRHLHVTVIESHATHEEELPF